jgi:DNA-binding PadR family transcriptional regulator
VPAALSTTSQALLGLLAFDAATGENGLTGYELKQRADRTLRFYWTSPAMSQIYTELAGLERLGLVDGTDEQQGRRTVRRYRINAAGRAELTRWLADSTVSFPVLKHPVALRLLMGALMGPRAVTGMLRDYAESLAARRAELAAVRDMLGDRAEVRYPAMVADWGLAYYDAEAAITRQLLQRVADESVPGDRRVAGESTPGGRSVAGESLPGGGPAAVDHPGG